MSEPKLCRHSRIEIYEDEGGGGFFGECYVCEGVGPLRKDKAEARKAMLALKVKRPSNQGGAREGAGRKKKLPDDAKFIAFTLLPKHVRKIERFISKHNKVASEKKQIKSRSAGLRQILDELKV